MASRDGLQSLLDHGVIDRVLRPLLSGKEAEVWLVEAEGEHRVAKIYKEADKRSFKHRSTYTEGRQVRRSRDMRAMQKGSRYGKSQVEEAWRTAEVDAIYRLRAAGCRVPKPFDFLDGVLVMELVCGPDGEPAPRLADVNLDKHEAIELHGIIIHEVVKMLAAGLVHGDLSDFNVLLGVDGPVIIDFPQAIDAAANQNAKRLLLRDVKNLASFFGRWAPKLRKTQYGPEMWDLYERGVLKPETQLTGRFQDASQGADLDAIIREIRAAEQEEARRREALGLPPPRRARAPIVTKGPPPRPISEGGGRKGRDAQRNGPGGSRAEGEGGSSKKRRRRRKKKRSGEPDGGPRGPRTPRDAPRDAAPRGAEPVQDLPDDLDALLIEE